MSATSTFFKSNLFSGNTPVSISDPKPSNLVVFLAAAQRLRIPFLPMTWDLARPDIGGGGTSKIAQHEVNVHASFAFKGIGNIDKLVSENEIYRCLINEIVVLGWLNIRAHSNIISLQGIAWDVSERIRRMTGDDPVPIQTEPEMWPVLVFQKSHLGDLYQFANMTCGQELRTQQRADMCLQMGRGLAYLYSHGIIHGDIKAQNVLIFQGAEGSFIPKIADFGCSITGAQPDDFVELHGTPLWRAPEYEDYPYLTNKQAAKMDVFSYGMTCLWFIFERHFAGNLPLQQPGRLPARVFHDSDRTHLGLDYLAYLKREGELDGYADRLTVESDLSVERKNMIRKFFIKCLPINPEHRDPDIRYSLGHLETDCLKLVDLTDNDELFVPEEDDFNLFYSLHSFYMSDYRLRIKILESLKQIVTRRPASSLCNQVSLACKIAFGVKNERKTSLGVSEQESLRLRLAIYPFELSVSPMRGITGSLYDTLHERGYLLMGDITDVYLRHGVLEEAEAMTTNDIETMSLIVGIDRAIILSLKNILSSIKERLGKFKEVASLQSDILQITQKIFGREHALHIASLSNLAHAHYLQGEWQQAVKLGEEAVTLSTRVLGEDHSGTLASMRNLALAYGEQARFAEAEILIKEVVNVSKRVLGHEHMETSISLSNMAAIYLGMGRPEEAKRIQEESLTVRQQLLDREHKGVEDGMHSLALSVNIQGGQIDAMQHMFTGVNIVGEPLHQAGTTTSLGPSQSHSSLAGRLLEAAKQGSKAEVQFLLEEGAGIESPALDGRTPLFLAAQYGHRDLVQFLLEKGANIEAESINCSRPLSAAATARHVDVVELLISKGAKLEAIHDSGRTVLCKIVQTGHLAMMEFLIAKGAAIDTRDDQGRTPLAWAAIFGHKGIVQSLLDRDADLETKDDDGMTPLLLAIEDGNDSVIELLMGKGANIETRDRRGWTALIWASELGDDALAESLLTNGAHVNVQSNSGQTALSYAACHGEEKVVQLLLESNATIGVSDQSGKTAISWAMERGHEGVVKLLQAHQQIREPDAMQPWNAQS